MIFEMIRFPDNHEYMRGARHEIWAVFTLDPESKTGLSDQQISFGICEIAPGLIGRYLVWSMMGYFKLRNF